MSYSTAKMCQQNSNHSLTAMQHECCVQRWPRHIDTIRSNGVRQLYVWPMDVWTFMVLSLANTTIITHKLLLPNFQSYHSRQPFLHCQVAHICKLPWLTEKLLPQMAKGWVHPWVGLGVIFLDCDGLGWVQTLKYKNSCMIFLCKLCNFL